MKNHHFSKALALILVIATLAAPFSVFSVGAEAAGTPQTSKLDILFTEEGYGFENFSGNSAAGAPTRNKVYDATGLYYQPNANAYVQSYTKDENGKLTASDTGDDQKLLLNKGGNVGFFDPRLVNAGIANLEEARYLTDILCSDTGYSKYTLEFDVAITADFKGTYDENKDNFEFSPYRGFSLLYLFSGWTVKATGLGVGNSITYDNVPYAEDYTEDANKKKTYHDTFQAVEEASDATFFNVTAVDESNAVADRGYLYCPQYSSNYIITEMTDANSALGTMSTHSSSKTFDLTAAIDFTKMAANNVEPVAYQRGVEKTLRIEFEATPVAGKYNDVYTATIYYDGKLLGVTSYTANEATRKLGIKFVDVSGADVTLDNIKLSVDTESEFRYCDTVNIKQYGDQWSNSYWTSLVKEHQLLSNIYNTYNNLTATISCTDCNEYEDLFIDEIIENNIVDLVGNKSYTIKDSKSIVTNDDEFLVVADIHADTDYAAPTAAKTLINIGGTNVLTLGTDGKLTLSDGKAVGAAVSAKSSYSIAVRAMPTAGIYQLYIDNALVGTAPLASTANTITFTSVTGVRLLNIKAVTLTATNVEEPDIRSLKDASATYCAHTEAEHGDRIFYKFRSDVIETIITDSTTPTLTSTSLAYSYICTSCGQREYVETGANLIKTIKYNVAPSSSTEYSITKSLANDEFFSIITDKNTFKDGADPFWFSFDFTSNNVSNKNDGNFFNFMRNYNSLFRYYKNNTDGSYIGCRADNQKKIFTLEAGKTYKIAIRIVPKATDGTAEIYIDGKHVITVTGNTAATVVSDFPDANRMRVGLYCNATFANIALVREAHLCNNDTATLDIGFDTINHKYNCCGVANSTNITGTLVNNIKNANTVETIKFTKANEYWLATDIYVKDATQNGSLLTFGNDVILSLDNGKLVNRGNELATVSTPVTYTTAVRVCGASYSIYINGELVVSEANLTSNSANKIILGAEALNYKVSFNYNKLVKLGTKTAVAPAFIENDIGTLCYHINTPKTYLDFSTKLVNEKEHGGISDTNKVNLLYATYICEACGKKVYNAEQGENLYNYGTRKNGAAVENTFITDGTFNANNTQQNIYVDTSIPSGAGLDYWINFSFKMRQINTEKPRTNPSNATNRGEANFLNMMSNYESLLRVYTVPNTVDKNTPMSYFQTSGTHFKIADKDTCSTEYLLLRSRATGQNIGLLYVGAEYDVTIHVVNGRADVYVNNQLVVTNANFSGTGEYLRFFDQPSGNYDFSNFAIVRSADSYVNYSGMGVLEAEVTHTANSAATTYTDLLKADCKSLLAVADNSGELVIPGANGYVSLYDYEGNKIVVGESATKIALVNNNGKFNYYVNDILARTVVPAEGVSVEYAQDIEIGNATGLKEVTLGNGVTLTANYGFGGSGTSEYVGYQKRVEAEVFKNQIRIIAGLNSPYYGNVGFKVTNAETGKAIESPLRDTNIYSSVIADNQTVYASDFGYTYFSILEIRDIDMTTASTTKLSVIPYTTTGKKVVEGEEVILTITIAIPDGESEYAITIK